MATNPAALMRYGLRPEVEALARDFAPRAWAGVDKDRIDFPADPSSRFLEYFDIAVSVAKAKKHLGASD